MKIEVGKRYINARGNIVEVLKQHSTVTYPFTCRQYSYTRQGERIIGQETPDDLICEVVPEIYETYKSGWYVSYKAFLIVHYEYYSGEHYEQTDL